MTKQRPLKGTLRVPGDKSISHRALVFAALAAGTSRLAGLAEGADVGSTAGCLRHLGADIGSGDPLSVTGTGLLSEPSDVLDAGNSGTTMRTLLGVCARTPGMAVLTGDPTLRRRPMLRVVAPLREMGAKIDGRNHGDLAPLVVRGGELEPIEKELDVASAQVKTAILLAGMGASGRTTVVEPAISRDHTERMLTALGAPIRSAERTVSIDGPWTPPEFSLEIPGDPSSAMYLIAAALVVPGSELSIEGLGLNPTRIAAFEVLRAMGAQMSWSVSGERLGEPVGEVTVAHSALRGVTIAGRDLIPRLIDELPVLAVLGAVAEGVTEIGDARELRVKESDRIATMVEGLQRLGVEATARDDGMVVRGGRPLNEGEVESYGDHRVALSFAVAGLVARGKVRVRGWSAVDTSFPSFLDLLGAAGSRR